MEIVVGIVLGVIGISNIIVKRSLMGAISGVYLTFLGAAVTILVGGFAKDALQSAHAVGVIVILSGVVLLLVGCAGAMRAFYLRKNISMDGLRKLKN